MERHMADDADPSATRILPDNVPPHLVFDYEEALTPTTDLDPYARARDLGRTQPPIFWTWLRSATRAGKGAWICTRYEDCREVFQNTERYTTTQNFSFQGLLGEDFAALPLAVDPPEHDKYRMLMNPWFSPKAVSQLEGRITAVVNDLIDGFVGNGEVDVAYDFGRIYPVRVFMELMGFPEARFEDFLAWGYAMLHEVHDLERVRWGAKSAVAYLRSFIEEMRQAPADNLTSKIVHGRVENRPLTDDEIIGIMFFLWTGGLDTVAATSTLMFRRLALDLDLQRKLRAHPDTHTEAVEEFLRMNPTVNTGRVAKVDHQLGEVQVKAGDRVLCFVAAGNFDPGEFDRPDDFVVERVSNRHLTLTAGPHRCLGSHLARRELRVALTEFLRRVPEFRIKPGADHAVVPGLVAMPRLPLVW
jgi:cytochrome P450